MASTCINEKSEEGNSKTFSEGGQGISSSSELDEAGFFTTAPNTSSLADTSALERFSAAVASAAASVSNTFNGSSRPGDDDQQQQHQATTTEEANRTDNVDGSPSVSVVNTAEDMSSSSKNMLRVPTSGYGGAIPRRPFSRDSSAESNSSAVVVAEEVTNITKTCFCGHYTEAPTASKRGRCKFCRSRAKYVAGQRSFDASRLFGRRRERGEPRRAASEDQRSGKRGGGGGVTNPNEDQEKASDEQKSMETTVSTSSLDTDLRTKETSTSRKTWRLRPSVRRQARLELDVPAASASSAQASSQSSSSNLSHANTDTSPLRDHGLRTPPGPPVPPLSSTTTSARSRPTDFNLTPSFILESSSQRYATHVMASDMSSLLAPPSRSGALARAHTDPTSSSNYEHVTSASSQRTPNSPPPTYEEVMKQVLNFEDSGGSSGPSKTTSSDQCCWWSKQPQYQPQAPRVAPPSYEEALSSRVVTSLRLGQGNVRSLSEDRVTSHPSPPPPFRARNSSSGNLRPLTRSSRVEEIPDIYWEQAARELDFCTCRKCQARYRQYFEEDLVDPNSDSEAMIPMETQFLMQEVLTDGMAFCSLM